MAFKHILLHHIMDHPPRMYTINATTTPIWSGYEIRLNICGELLSRSSGVDWLRNRYSDVEFLKSMVT